MSSAVRDKAIAQALADAGLAPNVRNVQSLTGGCIHQVLRLTLDDGRQIVAKINSASVANVFHEEAAGLAALAQTNTVLAPRPLNVTVAGGLAVFVMEALAPAAATSDAWRSFGEELAALHASDAGARYGFNIDNHLGMTPQPNTWCDDWVEFNAVHRLGHQLRLARSANLLDASEATAVQSVIDRLDQFLPRTPKPSLLHGDLWSGNALPVYASDGSTRIAVIDPAPYVGDGWADVAMMRLFGGFAPECFERYAANTSECANLDIRIAVYQLYHVLNHVNLFGRGYVSQAMGLVRSLY